MSHTVEIDGENICKNYGSKATLAQVLATVAQSFLLVGLGMELSMPTIVIHALSTNSNNGFFLTMSEISWYGSILFIFHPTGSFLSGILQEKFGRKRCMIFANIPSIFGWITLYVTDSAFLLYTSTVLMGLSIGFSEAPILSYVGEITEPRLRGSMSSLACTAAMIGGLLTFFLGYLYEWRTVALLSTLCPVVCICLVACIPESPVWLVTKGKYERAEKALCWLRGWVSPETIRGEHVELVRYNRVSGTQNGTVNIKNNTFFSKLAQFKDSSVYRPMRLVMIYFIISDIVAIIPCKPFLSRIMAEVDLSDTEARSLLMVIFAVLQNVGCLTVIVTVHSLGKRYLTMLSFSINTALIFAFGVYAVALKNNYTSSTPWIPIAILCGISFFGACVSTLPWILLGEIFPNKSRGIATGSCAGLSYLLIFILTKSYLVVETTLSLEYTMLLFSAIGIFGLFYLYFYLPETENKTLLEIETFFVSKTTNHP